MSAVDEKEGKFISRPVTSSDLLQWAIINKATEKEDAPARDEPMVPREPIDPKWVDIILGQPDSVRMKECVEIIKDASKTLDEKLQAFDELEMLIESLDNANDLRKLGLWKPIFEVLKSDPEAELRAFAAWVMGTAVQNNPGAQKDFLAVEGLPILVHALGNDSDSEVRAKCMTCLSGLVRHNPAAYQLLGANSTSNLGLEPVLQLIKSTNGNWSKAQKRAVFFLDGLVSGTSGEEGDVIAKAVEDAKKGNWAADIAAMLEADQNIDADLLEKSISLVIHLGEKNVVADDFKLRLKGVLASATSKYAADLDQDLVNAAKTMFQ
ncbi:Fes1-domain-containing protein [Rhizoclosmatium globosum]|uniref:Fes1-domain-containing protein n=1 Tax=Rhizoclosmatium globosum TaxID=329046 RepID=A0A1Y2D1D0_9FUNG|nr:Fes1-domain-containing protein [Rhizoclosmatium globosum]|eukprot:ORY53060.1 Fes1-domain-containing protein [Rhizoclosmatium globosum]